VKEPWPRTTGRGSFAFG